MPPLTPEQTMMLLQFLMQQGMSPAALDTSFGRTPIDVDKYGDPVPQGLDSQAQAQTFQRGSNTLLADPVTGIMAGAAGFDPSAFEPIVDRENPIERPGAQQLNYYLNRNPGTMGSLIAQHIQGGGDAASAYASVMQILEGPDSPDKQMLMASIPDARDNMGQLVTDNDKMPVKDFGKVFEFASKLESQVASDPAEGAYVDPQTGQSFNVSPSPAAQEFTDKGWALPTDRYSVEQMMGPDWMSQGGGITDPTQMRDILRAEMIDPAATAQRAARQALAAGGRDIPLAGPKTGAPVAPLPGAANNQPGGLADLSRLPAGYGKGAPQGEMGRSGIGDAGAMLRNVLSGGGVRDIANAAGIPSLLGQELKVPGDTPSGIGKMGPAAPMRPGPKDKALAEANRKALTALAAAHTGASQQYNTQFGRDYWFNKGRADAANQQGRTPLLDQFMARRMATISGGLPGGYLPNG